MLEKLSDGEKKSQDEKAHAARLLKRIKHFDTELNKRSKGWEKALKHVDGNPNDGDGILVRTNVIATKLDSVQTNIYAKSPDIAVFIDENIDTAEYPIIKPFAQTLEIALNELFVKKANLKRIGKMAVKTSQVSSVAWMKVMYQKDIRTDAIIQNRINDTQDNIERITRLMQETKENGGDINENEANVFELKQTMAALQKKVEVTISTGLVVDLINPKDLIILDSSLKDLGDYGQSSCIVHRVKIPVSKFKDKYKKDPPSGCKYYSSVENKPDGEGDGDDRLVCMFEAWSLDEMTVYTLIEGYEGYVQEPMQPEMQGELWYPFFPLQLRQLAGIKYPLSTAELLIELGDEYNHKRTSDSVHKEKNRAVRLLNKSTNITDAEIKAINQRSGSDEFIGISADPTVPLSNQIGSLPEIPYNPAMYDTSQVLFDIEMISGAQDAASGAIRVAKTATEAEIASAGQQGRIAEMIDIIEDCLSAMSNYAAQLLLQNVSAQEIQAQFGEKSVWPQLDKDKLFKMVNITIRAGSTAKPNKSRERDQWVQLMPNIKEAISAYAEAKQTGNKELENVMVFLLEETFKRFDEKIDVKSMLGMADDGEEDPEQAQQQQLMQQAQEMQQQLTVAQAENEQLKQIAQQAQAKIAEQDSEIQDLSNKTSNLSAANDVKHREIDVKNREIDLKEKDLEAKAQLNENDTIEKQVNIDAISQLVQQTAQITQTVSTLVDAVKQKPKKEGAKKKTARAVEMPDGSWVMESIEEEVPQPAEIAELLTE